MERWAKIPNYPNYEISDHGRVRNINTNSVLKHKEARGYNKVALYNDGQRRDMSIHRLVAEVFVDNPYNKEEVNHIDGDKHNNHRTNLEWCSRSDNMKHAFRTNLKKPSGGIPGKRVMVMETGRVYDSIHDCARDINGDQRHISGCLNGKRKTHKGYHYDLVDVR